jgi:hypothetical protein
MAHRIEAGPIVAVLGALLLLVSLFLDWFAPGTSAWTAFEALDLVLAGLALAAVAAAVGLLVPELAWLERRWLVPIAVAALVVVASQIINPPPAAANGDPEPGAWLGLAGALLMAAGALLSFGRVRFAVMVEGRDPRRRMPAVDTRPSARSKPASQPGAAATPAGDRLAFGDPGDPAPLRER